MTTDHRRRILGDIGESSRTVALGRPGQPGRRRAAAVCRGPGGAADPRRPARGVCRPPGRRPGRGAAPRHLAPGRHGAVRLPRRHLPTADRGARATRPARILLHTVRAGEFVLGYQNQYGQIAESPTVAAADDPGRVLPRTGDPELADLGRNGSYLVLRQLGQDVEGFRRFVDQASRATARPTRCQRPAGGQDGRALAERRPDAGARPPVDDLADANDFGYADDDAAGWAARWGPTSAGPTRATRWTPTPARISRYGLSTGTGSSAEDAPTRAVGPERARHPLHLPQRQHRQTVRVRAAPG